VKALSRTVLSCLMLVVTGGLLAAATPVAAAAPIDVDELSLSYRTGDWRLTHPLGFWQLQKPRVSWSVERGRLRPDGRLELVVGITPPAQSLLLEPGPAILFASLDLGGDGGSVGVGARVGRPIHVRTRPCAKREVCELRALRP
jgi:hypothetical protein